MLTAMNKPRKKLRSQDGFTLVYMTVMLTGLLLFSGLAVDSGRAYVVKAQLEEFERLYGRAPNRIDGHHHAHLCANVVLAGLLPAGTIVRRNFSFRHPAAACGIALEKFLRGEGSPAVLGGADIGCGRPKSAAATPPATRA